MQGNNLCKLEDCNSNSSNSSNSRHCNHSNSSNMLTAIVQLCGVNFKDKCTPSYLLPCDSPLSETGHLCCLCIPHHLKLVCLRLCLWLLAAVPDLVQVSRLPLALAPAVYERCMHQLVPTCISFCGCKSGCPRTHQLASIHAQASRQVGTGTSPAMSPTAILSWPAGGQAGRRAGRQAADLGSRLLGSRLLGQLLLHPGSRLLGQLLLHPGSSSRMAAVG